MTYHVLPDFSIHGQCTYVGSNYQSLLQKYLVDDNSEQIITRSSNSTFSTLLLIHSSTKTALSTMEDLPGVSINEYGGIYKDGKAFTKTKWLEIIIIFEMLRGTKGNVSIRMLARKAKISKASAGKAIMYYDIRVIVPPY